MDTSSPIDTLQKFAGILATLEEGDVANTCQIQLNILLQNTAACVVAIETLQTHRKLSPELRAFVSLLKMITAGPSSRMSTVLSPGALAVGRHFDELGGASQPQKPVEAVQKQPLALVEEEDHAPAGVINLADRRKPRTLH